MANLTLDPSVYAMVADDVNQFMIKTPKPVRWCPQSDITAHELAQAMPVLINAACASWIYNTDREVEALPDEVKRHFVIGEA
jgi:hypothetical protein